MRILIVAAVALIMVLGSSFAVAQPSDQRSSPEASPAASPAAVAEPGEIQIVSESDAGPGLSGERTKSLTYRIVMPPGGVIEPHEHLGFVTWHIERGEITFVVEDGEAWGQCADGCVDASAAGSTELLPVGEAIVFESGDTIVWHDTIAHSWENTGQGAAIIFASTTYDEGEVTTQRCGGGCK